MLNGTGYDISLAWEAYLNKYCPTHKDRYRRCLGESVGDEATIYARDLGGVEHNRK